MNTEPPTLPTEQDWIDALSGPIDVLLMTVQIVGAVAILLSLLLIIARSPKGPRR